MSRNTSLSARIGGTLLRLLLLSACLLGAFVGPVSSERPPVPGKAPAGPAVAPGAAGKFAVYLPFIRGGYTSPWANPQDRQASRQLYLTHYLAADQDAGWTGDGACCAPGSTSLPFRNAILQRINYFRSMAGLPAVSLADAYSRMAQAAALMMSTNHRLSHAPDSTWRCYSEDGAAGAGSSNLFLGVYAWEAIAGYMRDPGNDAVGHRRWILYPQTRAMGSGDVPPKEGYLPANALWVFDDHLFEPRPSTREEYVAWPPPGYVPYQIVFAYWSFAFAGADFSHASVSMARGGAEIPVSLLTPVAGYGENTLVWIPLGLSGGGTWPRPDGDAAYTVRIRDVRIGGHSREFIYQVTVFDPES